MNEKKRKGKGLEKHWEEVAAEYESPGIEALKGSRPLSPKETRELLGRGGKTKLVSIRIPEDDLVMVKKIAEKHDRKYQQLMTLALSQFIDRYVDSTSKKKTG